jgi:hypothetical protein
VVPTGMRLRPDSGLVPTRRWRQCKRMAGPTPCHLPCAQLCAASPNLRAHPPRWQRWPNMAHQAAPVAWHLVFGRLSSRDLLWRKMEGKRPTSTDPFQVSYKRYCCRAAKYCFFTLPNALATYKHVYGLPPTPFHAQPCTFAHKSCKHTQQDTHMNTRTYTVDLIVQTVLVVKM